MTDISQMTMTDENMTIIVAYAMQRFRFYQHQANQRGDLTQVEEIQEDREFITRSLILAGKMESVLPLINKRDLKTWQNPAKKLRQKRRI